MAVSHIMCNLVSQIERQPRGAVVAKPLAGWGWASGVIALPETSVCILRRLDQNRVAAMLS